MKYNQDNFTKTMEGIEQIKKYLLDGVGYDIGCGTNKVHPDIPAVDKQENKQYAHADVIHDCKDLNCFDAESLDFIFSSHVLEDFDNIPEVFREWWSRLKVGGKMVLLMPDMENGRYPKVNDPNGNPSHKTDVGPEYFRNLLKESGLNYTILQIDTVPHSTSTFDIVIEKVDNIS